MSLLAATRLRPTPETQNEHERASGGKKQQREDRGGEKGKQEVRTAGFSGEQKHGYARVLLEAVHYASPEVVFGGTVQANAS